jgi:DNA helicase MCM8
MDRLLSTHVMALHNGRTPTGSNGAGLLDGAVPQSWRHSEGYAQWQQEQPLSLRLRTRAQTDDPVPVHLLRKYIAYARQYAHPTLSREAAGVLREFYLQLRRNAGTGEISVPITSQQLESLVRLAEARARIELREKVTKQDAADAIDVFKETVFYDTLADAMGATGASAGGFGGGSFGARASKLGKMSAAKTINAYVSLLEREASRRSDAIFSTSQLKQVFESSGLPLPQGLCFADFLEKINSQNHLLKKGPQQWKLQASSFSSQRPSR